MRRYKSCFIFMIIILTFFFSSVIGTGILNPSQSLAAHAGKYDQQEHPNTMPNPPPPPPSDPCEAEEESSPRIHLSSGNCSYSHLDLYIPGRGISLEIERIYNSLNWNNLHDGPFGYGWTFSLFMRLLEVKKGSERHVEISRGNEKLQYKENPDGSYEHPPGRYEALTKNVDGTYSLSCVSCDLGCASCGLSYYFDIKGILISITDHNNNQMTFDYNGIGRLITINDASGRKLNFSYGENNKIASITDPANRIFSYAYDSEGNLISYTDPAGNKTFYAYDSEHRLISITDSKGNIVNSFTYDDQGRISSYTDKGGTYRLYYYPVDHYTGVRNPQGNLKHYHYNETGHLTQETDIDNNLSYYQTRDENFNLTSFKDERGYTTTYTYDANGNLLTSTDPLGNTTIYTYDLTFNQVVTITDPMGHVIKYEYDSDRNITKIIRDYGGALQNETIFTYDNDGNKKSMTDHLGNTTYYAYDAYGNLTKITDPLGNTTTYTYDVLGNKLTETDSIGYTYTYTYDILNRMSSEKDSFGNTDTFIYDAHGNQTGIIDAAGNITSYIYDSYNHLTQRTDPLGNTIQYTYDASGNNTSVIDPKGNTITYKYNALKQVISETDANGNTTHYTYDKNGNLLTITDANGNTTTNTYDALNRLIKITNPDGSIETFSYDLAGNLISRTDQNGNTITNAYDALNRLTVKTYPDGRSKNYTYDANGNVIAASNSDVSYVFTYDALNRVTKVTNINLEKTISYSYYWLGLRSSMTDPEGGVTTYTYDALKRLTRLTNPLGEIINYTYDNLYRIIRKDLPNGIYFTYTYDAAYRLLSLFSKTSSESLISSYSYIYDKTGNRTSMTTLAGNDNYSYDKNYQLLQATHSTSSPETYTYDSVYNRLTSSDYTNWTYGSSNILKSFGDYSFTYDNNGNMTSRTNTSTSEVTRYQYDFENRLKRIDFPDGTFVEYAYDPMGRRISKTINGATTYFLYNDENIIAEYDSTGALMVKYTHGQDLDEPISMERGGNSYYYIFNGLGSIIGITDSDSQIIQTYLYDSFGNIIVQTGAIENRHTFTGREYDSESGLYYYRARYYDPILGRFLSPDPLKFIEGANFYVYVKNNPVNISDPTGLRCYTKGQELDTKPEKRTIVCNGHNGIKVKLGSAENKHECLKECVRKHETVHKKDCEKESPNVCHGKLPDTKIFMTSIELYPSECKAYKSSISCLKTNLENPRCCSAMPELKRQLFLDELGIKEFCRLPY